MVQFYFLSVAFNLLCGLALIFPDDPHDKHLLRHFGALLADEGVRAALGILGIATGLLTLFVPIEGDVPIVGDIVPALSAILAGLVLILELYSSKAGGDRIDPPEPARSPASAAPGDAAAERGDSPARLRALLVNSGRLIGIAAVLSGLVHFLFPLELFL